MGLGFLYFFQQKIIFQPKTLPENYIFQFKHPFEEVFLNTKDGERLHAIHFKRKNPKGVLLYFHGNRGNLARWGNIAAFFAKIQYDVIVMDYRSYGKSTGKINAEQQLYDDAQLFYDYALKRYSENQIIVYGRSLGTGIASYISAKNTPGNLVLETPYYSMEDVAADWLTIFPVKNILKYKFSSYEYIQDVQCNITIYHGTADRVVPYASGKRLFESIPSLHKAMITVRGGGHNKLIAFDEFLNTIEDVLKK